MHILFTWLLCSPLLARPRYAMFFDLKPLKGCVFEWVQHCWGAPYNGSPGQTAPVAPPVGGTDFHTSTCQDKVCNLFCSFYLGERDWKSTVKMFIKMVYLSLCPNQNHVIIFIFYQEYHKCNTWCHNVLTCWYYCNNWQSNLLILHYIAKIITTASSYTWWSPVGLASDFQAWPGNGLGTGNKAKLGHAILAIVRHLWQKV